MTLSQTGSYS
ncbi:hypothetical protein F383_11846 [Gossypium arboreum]|uniref:Uncharacterized protein n=1 Tax=Gossypium arboreum TaxID=29729 RepID=A0A0B0PWS7_GOSAR|nr:hypothetical protein F383_11846 [Gossypium arboreum]